MEKITFMLKIWNNFLESQKKDMNLSELELSALSSWVGDFHESYQEISTVILEKLKKASPDDYELMHDCVVEIYWGLNHIKNHIMDSENGFAVLMSVLAEKAEIREKG